MVEPIHGLCCCSRRAWVELVKKIERNAVRDIMETATQASISCQRKIQTSSTVSPDFRPETRTHSMMAMAIFIDRKTPRPNFWKGLMRTFQRRQIGRAITDK